MRIITYGSCLSRRVSTHLARQFGGTILSSVYYNRSDRFLGLFVDKTWHEAPVDPAKFELREEMSAEEKDRVESLRDRHMPWVGLHRLPEGVAVFQALENSADLIILDNG